MAGNETLFSLEVIVENIENICVSCCKPAIAVRLLDFPTVVIRSERQELSTSNKTSYKIQSGKSCLFKMRKELLYKRLQNTPLYVMLVDTSSTKTKLLASTTISLVSCFQNILKNIEKNGLDIPAVSGDKGEFIMYNLMGTEVAAIKLGYRMFSFGVGMSGHVNLSLSKQIKPKQIDDTLDESSTKSVRGNDHFQPPSSATDNSGVTDQKLFVPEVVKEIETSKADAHTQTQAIAKKQPITVYPPNCDNLELSVTCSHNNITRPPPLYYNSSSTFCKPMTYLGSEKSLESTNDESTKPTKMSVYSGGSVRNDKHSKRVQHCDISVQTCEPSHHNIPVPKINASTQCLNDNQLGLPLIEALLNELTLVRTKYTNNDLPQQVSEATTSQSKNKEVKIHEKDQNLLRKPQDQRSRAKKFAHPGGKKILPTKANSKGVLIVRNRVKFKKSSLKCGTTRTQKLREAMSKKNVHGEKSVKQADDEGCVLAEEIPRQNYGMQTDNMAERNSKNVLTMNSTMNDESECKDVGIQVRSSDDEFPLAKNLKQDFPLDHSGLTNLILGATYINEAVPQSAVTMRNQNYNNGQLPSSRPRKEEHLSNNKRTLSPGELPKAKLSNISPTVPVASNARYRKAGISGKDVDSHFSEGTLSDESLNLIDRPVGKDNRKSERSIVKSLDRSFSSESRLSNGSLVYVKKAVDEYYANGNRSGQETQEKFSETRLSDESLDLVRKPVVEVHENSGRSSAKSLDRSLSSESRLSKSNLDLVDETLGEVQSGSEISSKELQDRSISSVGRLSHKNLGLVNKPVGEILSNSSYSDNFDSDDSDVKVESSAS